MIVRPAHLLPPALLLLLALPAAACSSFATYAGDPLYGMNFDYPASAEVRFVIETAGDLEVFQLTFSRGDRFIPTVGMNSAGLFVSDQILEGERILAEELEGETIFPGQLYHRVLRECRDVAAVRRFLETRRLIRSPYNGLHLLIADSGGDALIAEVGVTENVLLDIEGDFIVMTNFSHDNNRGRDHDDMRGIGAQRYRIIHEGLARNEGRVDVERAFTLLADATNRAPGFPTRCSMVFDPLRGQVFFAMEGDYTRIWRVSIAEGVVETYLGFGEHRQWPLGADGVLATDLD